MEQRSSASSSPSPPNNQSTATCPAATIRNIDEPVEDLIAELTTFSDDKLEEPHKRQVIIELIEKLLREVKPCSKLNGFQDFSVGKPALICTLQQKYPQFEEMLQIHAVRIRPRESNAGARAQRKKCQVQPKISKPKIHSWGNRILPMENLSSLVQAWLTPITVYCLI